MLRVLWRAVRLLLVLVALVLAIPLLGLAYGFATTWSAVPAQAAAPPARTAEISARLASETPSYKRPEESTYLTYPEWAIVYAAREYAGFVQSRNPSGFPYFAYIGRFWQDYATMIRASADYPFNAQNHVMLVVIGTSHTIEHAIQSLYENTIGRLTSLAAFPVAEDRVQAATAAEYAAFLDQTPWYRFPYAAKRDELWNAQPAPGAGAIRSYERKIGFGLAGTIKQGYAELIKSGLAATTDPALLDIVVWATGPVAAATRGEPDTYLLSDLGEDGAVFVTRRYQVFTDMIPRLIDRGLRFVEIGGNDEILVTVTSEAPVTLPAGARELFSYQLPAEPGRRRTGFSAAVPALHEILPTLATAGAKLEHVYDY
jgi:hypothetical protein